MVMAMALPPAMVTAMPLAMVTAMPPAMVTEMAALSPPSRAAPTWRPQ
jgi:hypothetical protein